jgi:hypothetical protein
MKFTSTLLASSLATSLSISPMAAQAVTDEEFNQLKAQFEQMAEAIESSPASSGSQTTVGGYGEMHYTNLSDGTTRTKEIDFHRFILFVGHEFSDSVRFFSEVEIEHSLIKDTADGSGAGEIELEQAYIEVDLDDNSSVISGLFLLPVGIINETHEPPVFYGTERNIVEKAIIPATWWEGGVMLSSNNATGLSYDIAVTSGLNVDPATVVIRKGRQKVAEALGNNLAVIGRLKYTGTAGLELAASIQLQDDITQSAADNVAGATLVETHAIWQTGAVELRALYARWDIDGDGAAALNMDVQDGGYLEASYKASSNMGFYTRYNMWDNGGAGDTENTKIEVGMSYWPHENVVFKLDYQSENAAAGNDDGINAGVGYQF